MLECDTEENKTVAIVTNSISFEAKIGIEV